LPAVEAGGLPITTSAITLHPDKRGRSPEPRTIGFSRAVVGDAGAFEFAPGGFLYRGELETERVVGFFCGYLTHEAWHYRT
jgi:hypothetical protein